MVLGTAIGLGTTLLGGLFGLGQRGKANRLEKNTVRPDAKVNNKLLENLAQAEQMANLGMPQEQYNQAIQNIGRNQNAAMRQASRMGGGTSIAALLRASNDATMGLDTQDAMMQDQNQRLAMQQRGIVAQDEQRVWDWNERQKYEQAMQQVAQLRNAGNQNIAGAVGTVAQMGIMGAFGGGSSVGATNVGDRRRDFSSFAGQTAGVNIPAALPNGQIAGMQPRLGSPYSSAGYAQNAPFGFGGWGNLQLR